MILLDTNVVSELRKVRHQRTDPHFVAWSRTLRSADLFLSVITLYELEIGVSRLESYDATQGFILRSWLRDQVVAEFGPRILPVDVEVSLCSARFQVPRTRQIEDTLIAATAHVHHLKIATRNVRDFADLGVEVIDPWGP